MNQTLPFPIYLLYILILWEILWKGLALWHAAKNSQRNWFIVMVLPINTVGILEIVYLFFFAKKKYTLKDLKLWEKI